ncbi:MAG: hypothetical protein JWL89_692 [Candidatus Saccharibacteria bacterium]|nr:hypothetical protein [Candidatus Saccharibacteria bacterium]
MKRFFLFLATFLLLTVSVFPAVTVFADTPANNLISNPSLEAADAANPAAPSAWLKGGWGSNTSSLSYASTGNTGSRSVRVDVTSYTDGDAKWYFAPVAVTGGNQYSFSDYYQSNVATNLVAQFDDGAGKMTYQSLATLPASSTWSPANLVFKAPATAHNVTVFHLISSVGWLQTDDFSLSAYAPAPAPTVSITAPSANTSVSNTVALTASATDTTGVAGVQFKVDGAAVGSEDTTAPYAVNWDSNAVINGLHSLTAVARNTSGQTSTSAPVQILVANKNTSTSNVVPNSSLETTDPANAKLPQSWQKGGWGSNTTAWTYPSNGHTGSRSVKAQISAYTNGSAYWYYGAQNVTSGQVYRFTDYYKSNAISDVEAGVTMADGSVQYVYIGSPSPSSTAWTKFDATLTMPVGAVSATIYHSINSVGWVQIDDMTMAPFAYQGFNRPLVSITIDDGYASSYTNGLPILKKYGFTSTNYIITGSIGTDPYMTKAQLKQMAASGQEIGSHTVTHPDLTTLSATKMDNELKKSQASLVSWLGAGVPIKQFASPYGAYNGAAVADAQKYYSTYRGVQAGYNAKNNFDPYNIRVQNLVSTTTQAEVQSWVDTAKATNTWLVLVYHQIDTNLASDDSLYNTPPADFDAQLAYIKASGIAVKNITQAMAELTPQLTSN